MSSNTSLLRRDRELRTQGQPYVLATIVDTAGSTYRKAGARMIIESKGDYFGLISGGCLEGDLLLRARKVFESGNPEIIEYDMRADDDLVWGLGLGCNGMIQILLELVTGPGDHPVIRALARSVEQLQPCRIATLLPAEPGGAVFSAVQFNNLEDGHLFSEKMPVSDQEACRQLFSAFPAEPGIVAVDSKTGARQAYVEPVPPPVHLLILGGGPDVTPLAGYADALGWQVTILDHRAAYANSEKFPFARKVEQVDAGTALGVVDTETVTAVLLMSHHFPTDCLYLRQVLDTSVPFIGLLGPRIRAEKLFAEIGADWSRQQERLHSPVGLDIGGESPEAIALSIVAEVQAFAEERGARPLKDRATGIHD